ncbi:hypothetical protein [Streptomyces sp. NBRC 109706]|uniref:hypothetical protein n=1 Tax=Streptomyces sp. NBRC 109706 TaxID=1550035 RepID=UPI0007813B00|nr:hypothetical protein [Streptomyces sp. NBRC 109706]
MAYDSGGEGDGLPFLDEHRLWVAAGPAAVWRALGVRLSGRRIVNAPAYARLVGADPRVSSGDSLSRGATLPGFRVAEATPDRRLRLTGRHRFSRYELVFGLTPEENGTLLSARSYAAFPGPHGSVYRMLVFRSGAHRLLVPRLLRGVRDSAQTPNDAD